MPQNINNVLFFFALLGQRGNSSARLGREAKTNNLQQNEAEPLRTKAADVNFGQEVRGFCVKRKYVTRSTGRKLHSDLGRGRRSRVCTQGERGKHINHEHAALLENKGEEFKL